MASNAHTRAWRYSSEPRALARRAHGTLFPPKRTRPQTSCLSSALARRSRDAPQSHAHARRSRATFATPPDKPTRRAAIFLCISATCTFKRPHDFVHTRAPNSRTGSANLRRSAPVLNRQSCTRSHRDTPAKIPPRSSRTLHSPLTRAAQAHARRTPDPHFHNPVSVSVQKTLQNEPPQAHARRHLAPEVPLTHAMERHSSVKKRVPPGGMPHAGKPFAPYPSCAWVVIVKVMRGGLGEVR